MRAGNASYDLDNELTTDSPIGVPTRSLRRRRKYMMKFGIGVAALAIGFIPMSASATTMAFQCVDPNSYANCLDLQNSVEVTITENTDDGVYEVTFTNSDPDGSFITAVYLDASTAFVGFVESAGVSFSEGATPPQPGGGISDIDVSFTADADSPSPQNGVGDGEFLTVQFEIGDTTLESFSADLAAAVHVQGFEDGGSEWGCSVGDCANLTPVPEPATFFLFGVGSLVVGGTAARRRRRKTEQQDA